MNSHFPSPGQRNVSRPLARGQTKARSRMQAENDGSRCENIPGLYLVKQIRNDPKKYIKRADLGPKRQHWDNGKVTPENEQRAKDYLTAPIDAAGYIDFSISAKARKSS